jgi:hypothetical protein
VSEDEGKGEASDDHYGCDEPPKVERARPIFDGGELIGTAVGE